MESSFQVQLSSGERWDRISPLKQRRLRTKISQRLFQDTQWKTTAGLIFVAHSGLAGSVAMARISHLALGPT